MRLLARGLALAAPLALALAAGGAAQAPALPRPGGPHPVGTSVHALVDSTRPDLASGQPGREMRVQAWYPRVPGAGPTAPYLPDAGVLEAMLERGYNRLEPEELRPLREVRTHAVMDAPVRAPAGGLPVLILSHGLGVARSGYTALAEELASRGYLVVATDHPYGGVAATRGGRVVTSADDPGDLADEAVLARRTVEWARDASLVLDRLTDAESALGRRFRGAADTGRAGMVGHSLGGAAALEACRTDPRFRACVDMDGLPFGPVREHGVGAPALVLLSSPVYSDEELAARGRTRAQWEEMGRGRHATFDSIFAKSPASPAWVVEVRGTGHMSFGDAPFVLPSTITRFGGTPIAAARAHEITAGYVRGFFDRFLRGRDGGPLGGEAPPEVRVRAYGRSTPGLSLRDCTVLDGAARARCGTFTVPEDRAAPGGRRIDLELVVVPAERPDPEPDPVFVLAGGPGQVATELTPLVQLLAGVHRDRDMVFVDQRGTGGSAPLLCPGAGEAPGEFGAAHDAYWAACLRELRRTADPRLYTTSAAVDDFDAVRAALGYDRVNLVGGSYGTRVAQVWLLRHPERIRSATLWAVAPADYDIPSGGGLAVQAAMQRLLAGCRADAACGAAFPRLGARLDSLLLALDRAPVEAGGVRITDELFAQTLLALLFDAEHLRRIPALVDRAARGEWERIAPVAAQVEAGGKEAPDALYLTVLCTEDVPRIRRARLAEFRGALGALLRESAEALQHRCARWPQGEPPAELRPPARSAVPVLLLSGEADPATPPGGGERALAYLANARHVEVPASSHGPIFPGCVKELVAEFIAHPDPARLDPGCVAEIRWRPFAVPEAAAGSGR